MYAELSPTVRKRPQGSDETAGRPVSVKRTARPSSGESNLSMASAAPNITPLELSRIMADQRRREQEQRRREELGNFWQTVWPRWDGRERAAAAAGRAVATQTEFAQWAEERGRMQGIRGSIWDAFS